MKYILIKKSLFFFCEIAIAMTLFYFFATLFFQSSLKNSTVCFFANSYFDQHVLSKTRDSWEVPVLLGSYCKIVAPSNPQYPPQKNEESWTNITKTNRLHPCLAEQKIIFVLWKIVRGAFSPSFKGRRFYLVLYINHYKLRFLGPSGLESPLLKSFELPLSLFKVCFAWTTMLCCTSSCVS